MKENEMMNGDENRDSKTVIYIDAANIILSAKNLDLEINIFKLIQKLIDKYRTKKLIYFTGKFHFMNETFSVLESNGVEIIYKEIYNENNKLKANCDVEISHRITFDIENNFVDRIILLSGDGDFSHLADYAKRKNILFDIIAVDPKSCSRMFKKRQLRINYLIDFGNYIFNNILENEKPPIGT